MTIARDQVKKWGGGWWMGMVDRLGVSAGKQRDGLPSAAMSVNSPPSLHLLPLADVMTSHTSPSAMQNSRKVDREAIVKEVSKRVDDERLTRPPSQD